jgi:hypothetical protein
MKKTAYLANFPQMGWPSRAQIKPFFFPATGNNWPTDGGNDAWALSLFPDANPNERGVNSRDTGIHLSMVGVPDFGVFMHWHHTGATIEDSYFSKGDLSKLKLHVRTLQSDARPLGFFIPFATAWLAVEDFMSNPGSRSGRIEWVHWRDLPFPPFLDPHEATCVND